MSSVPQSPLYGKHRKRPSSSSIDSSVSWSGSEIDAVGAHAETEQGARLSWASSVAAKEDAPQTLAPAATLFGAAATTHAEPETKRDAAGDAGLGVQPPKTPLGKPALDDDGAISAAQRVRMELSAHAGSRAGSRANSSEASGAENLFPNVPPAYDEEKNGPQSCPSTFNNTKQPQFSIDKLRQLRSNELVASKLLPTRSSVNSLMGYVRELQLSEASLRKQLVKTKQHTEEELSHSLSKVTELEKTMQEVERDREEARRKLEEQEQLIRDLAAKLKQAEAAKTKSSVVAGVDELPPIAEEVSPQREIAATTLEQSQLRERRTAEESAQTLALPMQPAQEEAPAPPLHPGYQPKDNARSAQFGLASPRSPNRPLWDPWASGGATPMKNLPPVFTIGSTGLDPVVSSSTTVPEVTAADSATNAARDYELKSVLMSPRRAQGQAESSGTGDSSREIEQRGSAVAYPEQDFSPQYPAPLFNVGAIPSPPYPQEQNFVSPEGQNERYISQTHDESPAVESSSQVTSEDFVSATSVPDKNLIKRQAESVTPTQNDATEWSGPSQEEVPSGVNAVPPPAATTNVEGSGGIVPPPPTGTFGEAHTSVLTPPQMATKTSSDANTPSFVSPPFESIPSNQQASGTEDGNSTPGTRGAPPTRTTPPQTSLVTEAQPLPQAMNESTPVDSEPVSLEALLVEFFTEVDKKRLKMAKAYGKRYAGREKWLFTELTKRYGAAKVGALKARFENGNSAAVPGTTTSSSSTSTSASSGTPNGQEKTKSADASGHQKPGRLGHPRHPQFFHPPTPASNVDPSANMPPCK
ncbi:unnamed protein product [Phytophthora fragariaefolia]|uniref:Unnamed protein product n=1 Tax=Phytophthora fragariaefolia TaxID=1490495 RepID=A0A9W6XSP0_9STRA|nr:unnamed protein product [Phytophthora fragariaefolia]